MSRTRNTICIVLMVLCLFGTMVVFSGCRASDALKEIIYDQTSDIVDYDNEKKFYINNEDAEQESEEVPAVEVDPDAEQTELEQHIVVYSSDPNTIGFTAKQSNWSQVPEFSGIEASSHVKFYKTEDPSASKQEMKSDTDEEDDEDDKQSNNDNDAGEDDPDAESNDGTDPDDSIAGDFASEDSSTLDDAFAPEGGAGDYGDDENQEEIPESSSTKPEATYSDLTGTYTKIPHVDSIAACGNVAVLIQMIGGKRALAAVDKSLYNTKFKSVFKDHIASGMEIAWSDDGETADNIDLTAIIDSGAEALLVPSSSYLTSNQKKRLTNNGVSVLKVYPMSNTSYILKNAETIGEMLSESSKIEYKSSAKKRAANYVKFCEDLMSDICKTANGSASKLAGKKTYEKKNPTSYTYNRDATYTLLIDDYDTSAHVISACDGWMPVTNGAALSRVGYDSTPASYYLQLAGMINTAAYCGPSQDGEIIVWQFNCNTYNFSKDKWSYSSGGYVDQSINVNTNLAQGWCMSLMNGYNADSGDTSSDLGTSKENFGSPSFPKLIAATQQVKDKLIENSADEKGIYHPYGKADNAFLNYCGVHTSGGSALMSTIGVDFSSDSSGAQVFTSGKIPDSRVCVSPYGLFSSWTDGGSPESFLLAAWANDEVNDDSKSVGWKTYLKNFYKEFYDYSLSSSEITTITNGIEKK